MANSWEGAGQRWEKGADRLADPTREDVIADIEAVAEQLILPQVVWTHEFEVMLRQVIREELRRVGLRPPMPSDYGTFRWNAEADAWERSDG